MSLESFAKNCQKEKKNFIAKIMMTTATHTVSFAASFVILLKDTRVNLTWTKQNQTKNKIK